MYFLVHRVYVMCILWDAYNLFFFFLWVYMYAFKIIFTQAWVYFFFCHLYYIILYNLSIFSLLAMEERQNYHSLKTDDFSGWHFDSLAPPWQVVRSTHMSCAKTVQFLWIWTLRVWRGILVLLGSSLYRWFHLQIALKLLSLRHTRRTVRYVSCDPIWTGFSGHA